MSGYAFAGWNDGTTTYGAGATYTLSSGGSPIVFTAQWGANATDDYSFNTAGGSPSPDRGLGPRRHHHHPAERAHAGRLHLRRVEQWHDHHNQLVRRNDFARGVFGLANDLRRPVQRHQPRQQLEPATG